MRAQGPLLLRLPLPLLAYQIFPLVAVSAAQATLVLMLPLLATDAESLVTLLGIAQLLGLIVPQRLP